MLLTHRLSPPSAHAPRAHSTGHPLSLTPRARCLPPRRAQSAEAARMAYGNVALKPATTALAAALLRAGVVTKEAVAAATDKLAAAVRS